MRVTWQGIGAQGGMVDSAIYGSTGTAGTENSCVTGHRRTYPRSGLFDAQRPIALLLIFRMLVNRWHPRKLHNEERVHFLFGWV